MLHSGFLFYIIKNLFKTIKNKTKSLLSFFFKCLHTRRLGINGKNDFNRKQRTGRTNFFSIFFLHLEKKPLLLVNYNDPPDTHKTSALVHSAASS